MAALKRVTKCPECYAPVASRHSRFCHKCNAQLYYPKRSWFGWAIAWAFFLFNGWMLWRIYWAVREVIRTVSSFSSFLGFGQPPEAALEASYTFFNTIIEWVIGAAVLGLLVLMTRPPKH